MTHPGQQPFGGYPQQPPVTSPAPPKPAPTRGRKPRGWHIAAGAALVLLLVSVVLASLPPKCTPTPRAQMDAKTAQSRELCISEYKRKNPNASDTSARISCSIGGVIDVLDDIKDPNFGKTCEPRDGGAANLAGWGAIIAAGVTLVLGLRRRKAFAEHRKNVHAVEDFIRRVPPGFEDRVPPQILSDVAQRGQVAAQTVFMEREYLGALTGAAAIEKADVYTYTAARAATAYAAMLPAMSGVPVQDEGEPLEAPDLGGATPTAPADTDDADDWLSGVDSDNAGDDW